jgi:superfamily II DNA/RNA helicase
VDHRILDSRQHLVVCAPTNSGKSLIGQLVLLEAVLRGERAVLLEPLRALAQEQANELTDLTKTLVPSVFQHAPRVQLSTGDYRLESEMPAEPPQQHGEIFVATPERLDAILRNPAHAAWLETIGSVVLDEAHLLADPRRGPTLELVIASMLAMPAPPRIALLSATVGEPERLREWLRPCQLITSSARSALHKEVWQLEGDEEVDAVLASELCQVLFETAASAVVFVYRREAAEVLARKLSDALKMRVLAYHSGLSASERQQARAQFSDGGCRCLIATTALAMGVNLPATHVFVRDTTFFGFGKLSVAELLQIIGRAGRGDRSGFGVVIVRQTDEWDADQLTKALRDETLTPLRSSFEPLLTRGRRIIDGAAADGAAATLVATCLARAGDDGLASSAIVGLLGNTLGARALVPRVDAALRWLMEPSRWLAYRDDDGQSRLTVLGRAGVRAMLPLDYVGGLGQLTRDIISLDPSTKLLRRWTALDHLFLVSLMSNRSPKLRRFSEDLASQVDGWIETRPLEETSLLFSEWVMGAETASKADELLGSLGIGAVRSGPGAVGLARKKAYIAMLSAIVLDERARGVASLDIERRWSVTHLDGTEESWRDTALWLLAGHAAVFEVRAFYHYLCEHCAASPEQIREVKRALGRMRHQAYDLLERLKYCSPLGPLMRGVRDTLRANKETSLGVGTIRKLELAGIQTMQQIAQVDVESMVTLGVQRRFARQIRGYIRRRLR